MGRQPDRKAQDVLDQITDIITNRYEDEIKYTARELREILDAIVAILDAHCAANGGGTSASQAIQSQPLQKDPNSQPVVTAVVHSDDRMKSEAFAANRWFAEATDEEIRELAHIDWGYDLEADRIAYFMEDLDAAVAQVLDYSREMKSFSREPIGFEVSVDKDQAMAWLAIHRPTLWQELKDL